MPAILAIELVVVFAGFRGPGTDAALGAAYLEQAGLLFRECDLPIEAVAAEIAEAPAAVAIGLQRIEHLARVVLGMRSREHDGIVLQRLVAVVVQLPVGEDIELVALRFQPGQQVVIGRVMAQSRGTQLSRADR